MGFPKKYDTLCPVTFEGDAEMFLRIEEHEDIRAHRLVRTPPERFYGCGVVAVGNPYYFGPVIKLRSMALEP